MAMLGLRWSQPILKIILVLVPRRFNVWVTCVVCISIMIASSILVFEMKLPRSENQPTSWRKDMFSNLWIHPLFTDSTIPPRSMSTLVKVEFIMLCVDSSPFQELRFTLVCISTVLQMVGVDKFCMRLKIWSKNRSTKCPMRKHSPYVWTLVNPSWLSIYSMTVVTITSSFSMVMNLINFRKNSLFRTCQMFKTLLCRSSII